MNQVTFLLEGVQQLTRALELTNANTRTAMQREVKRGTELVVAEAAQRVHRVSGQLASTIRAEYAKDGLTGYAKVGYGQLPRRSRSQNAKRIERLRLRREKNRLKLGSATSSRQAMAAIDLGAYAPVVERGDPRRHHLPHPFLYPSFDHQRPGIESGMQRALDGAIPQEFRG